MLDRPGSTAFSAPRHHGSLQPLISLHGVSYHADGRCLIDKVDLQIDRRGLTVIMGPNGAGKSVLMRLLHGLLLPAEGRIDWRDARGQEIFLRHAMVFQKPVLWRRSVAANIRYGLRLSGRTAQHHCTRLLELVGLADRARQPARSLSGGEQQRLALARAIATDPQILFLDESTANLDPASTAIIEKLILQLHRNGTKVILVTHNIGQAHRLADDIIFMQDGRICEHRLAADFFTRPDSPQAQAFLRGQLWI